MDQVDSTQTASLWDPPGPWDFPPPPPPGRPVVSRDGPGTPGGRPDSLGIPRRAPRPPPGTSRPPSPGLFTERVRYWAWAWRLH